MTVSQLSPAGERIVTHPGVVRTPFYFGTAQAPLFGWCHAPAPGASRGLAVVICPPIGYEYVHSHRSLRHLADRLAVAGITALRIDYHGVGDSSGRDEDPGRRAAWLDSIRQAIGVLRTQLGCAQVGLVGLRMGATLAALVATEVELACLALWAPCVRGRAYVREMMALQASRMGEAGEQRTAGGGDIEGAGFVLSSAAAEEVSGIDLRTIIPMRTPVYIGVRDDMSDDTSLRDAWAAHGLSVTQQGLSGYADMMAEPHNSRVPDAALDHLVVWIKAQAQARSDEIGPASAQGLARSTLMNVSRFSGAPEVPTAFDVRESIIYGEDGVGLFGLLSEPVAPSASEPPVVILANSGTVHRIGPNRVYTLLARDLAGLGVRCVRMDFPGIGDGVLQRPGSENFPYAPTSSHDLAAMIQVLTATYSARRFVVMGVCSGAYAAFHLRLDYPDAPIVECVLINPLAFYWKEGMSLDVSPVQHYGDWTYYMKSLRQKDSWIKLFKGRSDFRSIFATMVRRLHLLVALRARRLRKDVTGTAPTVSAMDDLAADLQRCVAAGSYMTMVFAADEPGLDIVLTNARGTLKRLVKAKNMSMEFVDYPGHTFDMRAARHALIARLCSHFARRYGLAGVAQRQG